jgi:hypothetical protein
MTTIMPKTEFDKKIDNIQHQLDIMRRESEAFRAHANTHFEFVNNEVATKEDVRALRRDMATKQDLYKVERNLASLTVIVQKIAEKIGVST